MDGEKKPNTILRRERQLRGWSQQKVAGLVGTSEDVVSRWERGERKPSPFFQEKLCILYGKSAEELGFLTAPEMSHSEQFYIIPCSDHLSILESEMKVRWSLYHTGGVNLAYQGLSAWVQEVAKCANLLRSTDLQRHAYTLLSMGYQLQGCVLRDMMCYPEAYMAHRKAFLDSFQCASSLTAQRGVNTALLHDYKQAVELIDSSLASYDPTLIRGRARLLAQKAEAYYELGIIDICVRNALDAFMLARLVGAKKTLSRIKTLHINLTQSQWRKDRGVADLNIVLTE